MQRILLSTATVDRLGVIASAACVVHCILTPVVLSLLAVYAHFMPAQDYTHRVLAVLVTALAAFALANGYRRHRQSSVLVLMLAGLALIFFGAFGCDRLGIPMLELPITLAGSTCLVLAHRRNHTFCQRCSTCDTSCSTCDTSCSTRDASYSTCDTSYGTGPTSCTHSDTAHHG